MLQETDAKNMMLHTQRFIVDEWNGYQYCWFTSMINEVRENSIKIEICISNGGLTKMKQTKYYSQKQADKLSMQHITTLRYDDETKKLLDEECKKSGLSQSQVVRKLIHHQSITDRDIRTTVLGFRDRLNHLAHIVVTPDEKNTLASLEDEYKQIQQQMIGGI